MNVQDKVIKIIAEQGLIDVNDVTLGATLDDLGINSLGIVESIFALEEEFDIEVPFVIRLLVTAANLIIWYRLAIMLK